MPKNTHTRIFKNIINNETLVLFVFVLEDCLFRKTELWELFDVSPTAVLCSSDGCWLRVCPTDVCCLSCVCKTKQTVDKKQSNIQWTETKDKKQRQKPKTEKSVHP